MEKAKINPVMTILFKISVLDFCSGFYRAQNRAIPLVPAGRATCLVPRPCAGHAAGEPFLFFRRAVRSCGKASGNSTICRYYRNTH
ncbi:MAG: hypothetical protein BECKG1743D_GA0114223_108182 [Candidatus Kentron sp. G]|nr:MAG: hypothetical protein BECKG1743F_GA0114225_108092 [Candidatus Kentron sp. G]VFN06137.1 MAG: hypothetical protein BECKG1743D_GA0114223_108182 [Candidatus Kentron sp. G]